MFAQPVSKPARGFTLLELMIVLFLVILGFGVLGNSISSGNQSTQLQAAVRDIASALRYAHGQAIMTRMPFGVAVNLDAKTYRISDRDKIYHLPSDLKLSVVVAEQEFNEGDEGEGREAVIRFFADGSSTGGTVTLNLAKQIRRIDVNWITGEVTLSD